jgi:Glycosyl transferase family 2
VSKRNSAKMSVVLVTPDRYDTIRKTMHYLREQTVRGRLEIVIVAPSAKGLQLNQSELKEFCQFRVVEVGAINSVGRAWAAGVREASAPVVVFTEDHCYPEPGWAETLIKAHRGPWVAVGPVMANANPASLTSWANFFVAYGRWAERAIAAETDDIPPHNSAYKRAILLEYGVALEAMLEVESLLHQDLRTKGYRLYWEPGAKTFHVNYTVMSSWVRAEFHYGRLFGAARSQTWPLLKRLIYIFVGPLIPFVRLRRVLTEIHRTGKQRDLLPMILPAVLIGLAAAATGEMFGYALGAGAASQGKWNLEFHRYRHLRKKHGQILADS